MIQIPYVKLSMSANFSTTTIAKSLKTGLRLVGIIAFALTASWIFNWLIACVLTIIYRPWESTPPLHYRDFQRWKQPWELAGSAVGGILVMIYLMRSSYVSRVVATQSSLCPLLYRKYKANRFILKFWIFARAYRSRIVGSGK